MPTAHRKASAPVRRVAPWQRTERDRGYQRRKAAADARLAEHVYDPERCKEGCPKRGLASENRGQ